MFCFQCQETLKNSGCTKRGVCGKEEPTANMQDLLIHTLKGIALHARAAQRGGVEVPTSIGRFVVEALFTTVTNVDFDAEHVSRVVEQALVVRNQAKALHNGAEIKQDAATWIGAPDTFADKATSVGVQATENEDVRSLRELLVYGLKGIAAYADHAAVLGHEDPAIYSFLLDALASTTEDLSQDKMVEMVMKAGETAVTVMALLDKANTSAYGQPELTKVNIGVGARPGILISGHDLKDLEELLEQSKDAGIDIYTHGEMLPAHYYPAFKKYDHLVGNYGNAWWQQQKEFDSFNGPILLTTNCIVPVRDSYKDRIYTTGRVAYPGVTHIPDRKNGSPKDFSAIIEKARGCKPPTELESGEITGGFAHNQVLALADKVVAAVKTGAIKRFVVMAGCDGRQKGRSYYTEVAENLPKDTIILTAGCAKYRYNKLDLGDIGGIPRVLDAGQCNDSYSLAVVALKLKEVFGLADINELPISFDIAWYEQKAVTVLLALLHLGVKGIRLGPTLPAFLSPNVAKVLVDNFDIKPIGDVQGDIAAMMAGN
ncbi:MAG TPA: hydroxylamine reductase [Myxococcota bacterium]|jgi:hydroxylamine reductase|nr:hydroxylamine reductase [Myxococcota bacterium]HPL24303.1 hydroxylamine reductase [Myxococcota bacterium]HQE72892.1 hydroxylamine reductase [Myxococcota bacterium]